ncbi:uncharacterized protein TNCV_492391 [Trichonephila clavipes]|nr:uncharacterized protein TNCV_492391 [Trichonephila clavipes]
MTCNSAWPEITRELIPGQNSTNRHDLTARVFKVKVQKLVALPAKGDSTIWLDSTPILMENSLEMVMGIPVRRTSRKDLQYDACLEYPQTTKSLNIYKHPCLRQGSNPGATVQQSASLTAIPDGRLF